MATLPIREVKRPAILARQSNGKLSDAILDDTVGQGPTVRLVLPAARAWRALSAAALAGGHILKATSLYDSYRPYEVQEAIFRTRYRRVGWDSGLWWDDSYWVKLDGFAAAAIPGTSNHGWGLAVDIGEEKDGDSGVESIDEATVLWLVANADRFGFSGELQSEPWHWRYFAGDAIPAAVLDYEGDTMPDPLRSDDDFKALIYRANALFQHADEARYVIDGKERVETNQLKAALAALQTPQVDASAVADALATNQTFLAALAKAVNDEASARLAE